MIKVRDSAEINWQKYLNALEKSSPFHESGKITKVVGFLMEGYIPGAWMGTVCEVYPNSGEKPFLAEVVGFREKRVLLMPLGDVRGVGPGAKISLARQEATVKVGPPINGASLKWTWRAHGLKGTYHYRR